MSFSPDKFLKAACGRGAGRVGERGRGFVTYYVTNRLGDARRMGLVVLVMSAVSGAGAIEPAPEAGARFLPIAAHAWAGSSVNVVANIRQSLFPTEDRRWRRFTMPTVS